MARAGGVIFGAVVSKFFGLLLVDGKRPVDDVVVVDGAALLRHAGLEVKATLPGVSCHTELDGASQSERGLSHGHFGMTM